TLKPVFEEVSKTFHYENLSGNKPQVNFIEVNCEVFGNSLCSTLPGFPIIHVIKPKETTSNMEETDTDKEEGKVQVNLWNRILNKVWRSNINPNMHVEPNRIVQFEGRRDATSITNFIRTIILIDKERRIIKEVLDPTIECNDSDELCLLGETYIKELLSNNVIQLASDVYIVGNSRTGTIENERSKLKAMQINVDLGANDKETLNKLHNLKFLSSLLNHLEDSMVTHINDEL
ncbi:Protein disulfide isomerase, partial [Maudiozyma exigua]